MKLINLLRKIFYKDDLTEKESTCINEFDIRKENEENDDTNFICKKKNNEVNIYGVSLDKDVYDLLRKKYIAFDVETTGLNESVDRIIEIGAIIYENGIPTKRYETLVNAKVEVPQSATNINHITNEMLQNAPQEKECYENLVEFLGDALNGETIICAHNAKFDMKFLSATLKRLGYDANISYIDTLALSRIYVKGLINYKQNTVAEHFNLCNKNLHRAGSDAEICGNILWNLLDIINIEYEKRRPTSDELEVCAVIQNIISKKNNAEESLAFYKLSGNYVEVSFLRNNLRYGMFKFKFAKKGKYIIVSKNIQNIENFATEFCVESEGGKDFIRLFFNSPLELEKIDQYLFDVYKKTKNTAIKNQEIMNRYRSDSKLSDGYRNIFNNYLLEKDIKELLNIVRNKQYPICNPICKVIPEISVNREDIEIHPIHNRIPIDQIKTLEHSPKAIKQRFVLFEKGEILRKEGNIKEAIRLYDKARYNGYDAPALYKSYAMAYRKLKDYDNEIAILDEGIAQYKNHNTLITRRQRAIQLLLKQRNKNT
ncbi:exonuclease domain-containing protein [Catellicoccus marimammalium]|uniref:DNA polymerase III polC-type n=1 Tax=Catellicoccus marimammalium M35/04/3 TaxID=1234409 RepID=K8ZKT5_9ENTE|nr:exonuclease domain-containing protein [Catellicoccus marimammalium]EKU27193.1 DNA polymerase III alpha subunit [Catellicoccus marimammalium M35/04/3]